MSAVKLDILGGITIDPHIDLGETVALTGNHGPVLAVCACPAHGATPRLDVPLAPGDTLELVGGDPR